MNTHQLVASYLKERRTAIDNRTLKGYRYTLMSFASAVPPDPRRIRQRHVERWLAADAAPSTRRRWLSVVRNFFEWAQARKLVDINPTAGIRPPREPARLPRNITQPQAAALLDHVPDSRGRVMLLLMVQEALRCCEVARAQTGDIDVANRTMAVRGKGGRGDVTRIVPLSEETAAALKRYWSEYPAAAGPLIRNQRNPHQGISAQYISLIVGRWFKEAGLKDGMRDGKSAHALRHTALQDIVNRGAPVQVAQKFAGHASISTTMTYLRGEVEGIREAVGGRRYAH